MDITVRQETSVKLLALSGKAFELVVTQVMISAELHTVQLPSS
jgi:hypothetical protein